MEMAQRLLERDVHEKQDSMVTLRKQVEDVKTRNIQLYNSLQVNDYFLGIFTHYMYIS